MRPHVYRDRKPQKKIRGFANVIADHQPATFTEQHSQPIARKEMQHAADNSDRVKQLQAYQQMANHSTVVQRYTKDSQGHFLSENEEAFLADGTKNLFLLPDALETATSELNNKNNTIFTLQGQGNHVNQDNKKEYQKVDPVFLQTPQNRLNFQSVQGQQNMIDDIDDQEANMNKLILGIKRLVNNISCCCRVRPFAIALAAIEERIRTKRDLENSIVELQQQQDYLIRARQMFTAIQEELQHDDNKQQVLPILQEYDDVISCCGEHLRQRLFIYCRSEDISVDEITLEVDRRKNEINSDLDLFAQDAPYLPTDCRQLQLFLTNGSHAIQNGGNIGDYHYDGLSDVNDPDKKGPWSYHYATIIFKDGDDTVTLEDAAGQSLRKEKSHWYFKMYGTSGTKKGFSERTRKEYYKRMNQKKRHENLEKKDQQQSESVDNTDLIIDLDDNIDENSKLVDNSINPDVEYL
ncbi:MAG: hypothetical protein V4557_10540 [Bacteroidota bacterium]